MTKEAESYVPESYYQTKSIAVSSKKMFSEFWPLVFIDPSGSVAVVFAEPVTRDINERGRAVELYNFFSNTQRSRGRK
jgi:hypothetical protein